MNMAAARKRNTTAANAGRTAGVPMSVGGLVLGQLRPRLPGAWQYGWRWKLVQSVWVGGGLTFCIYLGRCMFGKTDEEVAQKAAQYSYVRDDSGIIMDLSYTPLVSAGLRARARAQRLRDEMEDE